MSSWILVFAGGGVGACLRWWLAHRYTNTFILAGVIPAGTFVANLLGCFFLGVLYARQQGPGLPSSLWYFLATGFCGGLTTFSTLILEVYELQEKYTLIHASSYVVLSVLTGVLCLLAGIRLGHTPSPF